MNVAHLSRSCRRFGAYLSVFSLLVLGSLTSASASALTWTPQTSGTTEHLREVWGTDASNIWAVGNTGTILKYNGTSWSAQTSGTTEAISGVWGSSATSLWAVGTGGTILRTTNGGANWSAETSNTTRDLHAVWGSDANNVWAVGGNSTFQANSGSVILKRNSATSAWEVQTLPSGVTNVLTSITGTSASNAYAVGWGGKIVNWNGSTWATQTSGTTHDFYSIWAADASNLWAVNDAGEIYKSDGSTWAQQPHNESYALSGIAGTSATDIRAVGGDLISKYNSTATPSPRWSAEAFVGSEHWHSVWAADETHYWVVGLNGDIYAGTLAPNADLSALQVSYQGQSTNLLSFSSSTTSYSLTASQSMINFSAQVTEVALATMEYAWNGSDFTPLTAGDVVPKTLNAGDNTLIIRVTNGGVQKQYDVTLTYTPPPTLTSVSPAMGSTAGGTVVTLTGTGFTGASSVTFGGTAATAFTVDSATQITATTPAHALGAVSVIVTTPGDSNAANTAFTYEPPPNTDLFSFIVASQSNNLNLIPFDKAITSYSITRTEPLIRFSASPDAEFVATVQYQFNGGALTSFLSGGPLIPLQLNAGANTLLVRVTNGSATKDYTVALTYTPPAPTLTSVSPATGSTLGGTVVTLTGTGFTGASSVTFGGTAATAFTVDSATQITATTPAHALGAVSVIVTTPGDSNAANTLFTYAANTAPVLASTGPLAAMESFNLAENTAVAIPVIGVTDADSGQTHTWALSGADAGMFQLIARTSPAGTYQLAFKTGSTPDFETKTDANGDGIYEVIVTATDSGTPAASDSVALSFTIQNDNDAPTVSAIAAQSTNEDTPKTIAFTVADQDAGQSAAALVVAVTVTVTDGNIALIPETAENIVLGGSGASRTLTLTPAADLSGTAEIDVTVSDGIASTSSTFTFTVNAVNDAPSFTLPANITRFPGSGAYTQAGVVSAISPGPADESGQTVTFSLLPGFTNPGLFTVQPTLAVDGSLSFTPGTTPGVSTLTVRAQDSGGAATEQTFTITTSVLNTRPAGEVWTARESNRKWQSITSSADGSKLAAVVKGGQIYTSTDSGVTWTARASNRNWISITSSADGSKLAAVVEDGHIYTSSDSGVTWTPRMTDANRKWASITSSADGSKLAAVVSQGQIYTSTDSGVTWTARETERSWRSTTSSADGSKLAAVVFKGQIYTSSDSGVTWTPRETNRNWWSITSSADGSKLAAIAGSGQIYTSTDSGVTWRPRETNRNWWSITSSADGSKLAAVVFSGRIYTSTDSGVTWTARESKRIWTSITSSADGSKLAAVASDGQIYTSEGSSLPDVAAGRAFTQANFTSADTSSNIVSYQVTNNNPALFAVQPAIAANGTLTFTAGQNVGTATVTVTAVYNGGAVGPAETFTVNVTKPLKVTERVFFFPTDAPAEQDRLIAAGATLVGDFSRTFYDAQSDLPHLVLSGPDAAAFDLATTGFLEFKTVPVFPNPRIGSLGVYDVTLSVGSATSPLGIAKARLRISNTDVNDMPSFTKGADQSLPATLAPQIIPGWATGIDDGDSLANQALSFTVTRSSGPELLSAGPTIDPATGNLSFTPSGSTGTATYSVTLTDDASINGGAALTTAGQTFTITITPPPPTLTSVAPAIGSTLGGTPVTLTGTNFAGPASVTIGGTTATAVTVVNATTITCTTPAHALGAVSVIVTTPGGSNAANTAFTYVVPNTAPVITFFGGPVPPAQALDHAENVAFSFTFSATDADLPAQALTWSKSGPDAAKFTLSPSTGAFALAPLDFETRTDANTDGVYEVTFTVTDNGAPPASDSVALSLTITDENEAPTISAISAQSTNEDTAKVINFTIGDPDASSTLTVEALAADDTLIPDANLVISGTDASRTLTVTPAANLTGSSTIDVTVSDGTLKTTSTFPLTVNPVNDVPSFVIPSDQPAGETWTVQPAAGSRDWLSITSSADGSKLAAVGGGQIYTSSDSGATWMARDAGRGWYSITSSADGSKLAAVVYGGQIYTSTDSGATWTARMTDADRDWQSITSSADGSKLAAVVRNGQIYTSSDSGATWTARDADRNWSSITSSADATKPSEDGSKLAAVDQGGQIYTSSDSGATWTARDATRSWSSITSSADGSKLAAVVRNGQIYTSSDSGATWTAQSAAGSRNWYSITSSADGSKLAAVVQFGQIYTSSDSGATWTARDANRTWSSITSSADGSKLAAVGVSSGQIYTSAGSAALPSVAAGSGAQSRTAFATSISPGPANESGQTVSFTVTNTNNALFTVQPAISANGTLTYTPGSVAGTASVSIVAVDNGGTANGGVDTSAAQTFTLTLTKKNEAPTISAIAAQSTNEDTATAAIGFTIGDPDAGQLGSLTVSASSSDTALIPNAGLVLDGSGASRTLTITPAANANGTATITVTVSDGTLTASQTFPLTVNPVNDAPTLAAIANPAAIALGSPQQTVSLAGISAGPLESQTLIIAASSSNPALIPQPSVSYSSPAAVGSVSYTPVAGISGSAVITVTVTAGQAPNHTVSQTFTVTVNPGMPQLVLEEGGSALANAATVAFGTVVVGTELQKTFTLRNPGAAPLSITSLALGSGPSWQNVANPFDVNGDGQVTTLDVLPIVNSVSAEGPRVLPTPAPGTPPYYDVNGDGSIGAADISLVAIYLNSRGRATPPPPTTPAGLDFSLTPPTSLSLDPGASRTFTATFKPQASGEKQLKMVIISNDPARATAEVNLSGTGVARPILDPTTTAQIQQTQAQASSSVTGDGGSLITERGFLYAVKTANADPQLPASGSVVKVVLQGTLNAMSATLTGLTPGTEYALRSFATNASGTTYSPVIAFTTLAGAPEIAVFEPAERELRAPQLVGWGANFYDEIRTPTNLTAPVKAVAAGYRHNVAVLTDGSLRVWGSDPSYDVFDSYENLYRVKVPLLTIPTQAQTGVQAVATSKFHIVVLKTDGSVFAWGDNSSGQCNIPAELTGKMVTAIAAGSSHTLALTSEGKVVAWGDTLYNQSAVPDAAKSGVKAIAAGRLHSLALKQDGTVIGWGSNQFGRIPTGLTGVTAIAAGSSHSLVLKSDGSVLAFGYNGEGQSAVPAGLGVVKAIAAGDDNSAAVKADGSVVVWGDNSYGETTGGSSLRGVQQVAVGYFHIYALTGTELDFGSQGVGSSSPAKAIKVKNTGTGPLTISGITVTGDHAADYAIASAPSSVAAGSEATFTLTFTPSATGTRSASLEIKSNDSDEATLIVPLTGGSTSANADLASLGVSAGSLMPAFDPAVTSYSLGLPLGTSSVSVTPKAAQANASVVVSVDGSTATVTSLAKTIRVIVTAQNGSTRTYELKVSVNAGSYLRAFLADSTPVQAGPGDSTEQNVQVPASGTTTVSTSVRIDVQALTIDSSGTVAASPRPAEKRAAVAALVASGTINGTRVIDASGIPGGYTIRGYPGNAGLMTVAPGAKLRLIGVTLRGGEGGGLTLDGAAIENHGELELIRCTLENNNGRKGGAIFNSSTGSITLERCTLMNNYASETGGAIHNEGSISLRHCTVAYNSALDSGGGIYNAAAATCTLEHCILAPNLCLNDEPASDLSNAPGGTLTRVSSNLILTTSGSSTGSGAVVSGNPLFLPAYSLLGEPATLPLDTGSPAINAAIASTSLLDQRGQPASGLPDLGSLEYQNLAPEIEGLDDITATLVNTPLAPALTFTLADTETAADSLVVTATSQDQDLIADGSITIGGSGANRSLTFSPMPNATGSTTLLVEVSDGTDRSVRRVSVEVLPRAEIAVQGNGLVISAGDTTPTTADLTHFGNTVLNGSALVRRFTIENSGGGTLGVSSIAVAGADFTVGGITLPATVAAGSSQSFTLTFNPSALGQRSATVTLTNDDEDEGSYAFAVSGTGIGGAHVRLGDVVELDLSGYLTSPGETLKVLGLPAGVVLNPGPPPMLTGTVLGVAPAGGTTIQVFNGATLLRSLPYEINTDSYLPAGSYELLLERGGQPVGKLAFTLSNPTVIDNPAYTATLDRVGEARRVIKGNIPVGTGPLTVSLTFPAGLTFPAVNFALTLTPGTDTLTGTTVPASGTTARGFRLARPVRIPGGAPALTVTLPPAVLGNRTDTPGGIGFAKGSIAATALVSLSGQLGDAQPFTTGLSLSQTNQAVVWLTPYANKTSYVGGIIDLGDHGSPGRAVSRDHAATSLQWKRVADAKATSYPSGFGPLALDAQASRWIKQAKADALAGSLGLINRVADIAFIAPPPGVMPTRLSLRDDFSLLRLAPNGALRFSAKAAGTDGTLTGNLTLPAPAAASPITGALLQDKAFGNIIGYGMVKIPVASAVVGSYQTAGIILTRNDSPSDARLAIGTPFSDNLSRYLLNSDEKLKVTGLPAGLTFTAGPPPMISGTLLAAVGNAGMTIQVLRGTAVVRTYAYGLDSVPYLWAGGHELLLENGALPAGKLRLDIVAPAPKAASTSFTAKLDRLGEAQRSLTGSFADSGSSTQTVVLAFPGVGAAPAVSYFVTLTSGTPLVSATTLPASGVTGRGFRLASGSRIPVSVPLLTMTFPPAMAGDRSTTPGGIGWASGSITATGAVALGGTLGDGKGFSASVNLSATNQAVVWLCPYANKTASYLGGIVDLGEKGAADRGASAITTANGLKWTRAADAKELSYPSGFGPLDLGANVSRWFKPTSADALANSLGLSFRAINASYLAPTADLLPTRLSLQDGYSLRSVQPSNAVPFAAGKATDATGRFSGTLTLPAPATLSGMSGVFLQDERFGSLIGQGLITLPITAPLKGSFQTIGVELRN